MLVLDELGHEPDLLLTDWLATSEGKAYAIVAKAPRPTDWRLSADNLIEDNAEACARYILGQPSTDARNAFFAERNFK